MKVECENLSEREATPELIRELIRDDMRRGEFMILMQDEILPIPLEIDERRLASVVIGLDLHRQKLLVSCAAFMKLTKRASAVLTDRVRRANRV